jgi:hypothetical protein
MSHPIQFVDYACGHSVPIRGASNATVDRPCNDCLAGSSLRSPKVRQFVALSVMLGYKTPSKGESPS